AGRSAVVIDPKGDLVNAIVARLPKGAEARTCILDPTDHKVAVGLNVLAGDDPDLAVDHVVSVFKRIWERSWGPRSDDIMRAVCLTLTRIPQATLAEVPLLLTDREVRAAVRHRSHRFHDLGDVVGFWEQFEKQGEQRRSQDIAPLMNKVRAFLLRGPVRAIVGQDKPKLNITSLIENGGLLLVRIPKGTLGEETSRILGAFVVARVWQACMSRADLEEEKRKPLGLYVDEMHNYLALPRSFEDMLAEARAYGLSMVLAHQHLGQLPNDMKEALSANARTKIAFACSPDDARNLDRHFAPFLSDHDLASLGAFTAACRPCIGGAHGGPFTFVTDALPVPEKERTLQVKAAAARFGEDRKAVEARIRVRQSVIKEGKW
ncbi:MAG: type IV secretory system conjugative DNA transfer family protein, partial [Actinomycetota bacterium]